MRTECLYFLVGGAGGKVRIAKEGNTCDLDKWLLLKGQETSIGFFREEYNHCSVIEIMQHRKWPFGTPGSL